MIKTLARAAAITLLAVVGLVACSDDQQACAASMANNPPKPPAAKPPKANPPKPGQQRTTSRVQDKPRVDKKATTRPTAWSGYNDRANKRNWTKPYRKGYPAAPQPVIINQYGHDYRTYPGYVGFYPVGVWPVGYGHQYGCSAEREADPERPPTPAPTVTVTAPPTEATSGTPTPTATPGG